MRKSLVNQLNNFSEDGQLLGTLNYNTETIVDCIKDHRELLYRNSPDQHTIASITGLSEALENGGKVDDIKVNGVSVVDENKIANIELSSNMVEHNLILNRELPNQHPISSITGLNEALENSGKIDDVKVNGVSVVDENKVANIELSTDIVKMADGTSLSDVLEQEVKIGNVPGDTSYVPSYYVSDEQTLNMTYSYGGSVFLNNEVYHCYEQSDIISYFVANTMTGDRTLFDFPALKVFDYYDGENIHKATSDIIDLRDVGEWEIYSDIAVPTGLMCIRVSYESLGVTDYEDSDGEVCNAWLSSSSFMTNQFKLEQLLTGMGVATKEGYIYLNIPQSLYDSQQGSTVTEKVRNALIVMSEYFLMYKKSEETVEYKGKTVIHLLANNTFVFNAPPLLARAKFKYILKLDGMVKKITKNGTQTFLPDSSGNLNLIISEPTNTVMETMPPYNWSSSEDANLIFNKMKIGISYDNVLYISGRLFFGSLTASGSFFQLGYLPSSIRSKITQDYAGAWGTYGTTVGNAYEVTVQSSDGKIYMAANTHNEHIESTWISISAAIKL